jgi:probable O-glycosylation ligase (exosortase A-associated)
MRDIVLTAVIFGLLPYILWRPHIGILVWTWLGLMNPHRLCWGFALTMPFAYIVAVTTLISLFLSKEPKKMPWTRESLTILVLLAWMTVTTIFSVYPELAWFKWQQVVKILVMIFASLILMQSKERINQLMWVIAMSLAFYGVKGGIFTILNGGVFHVRGPDGTFIGGDNEMGLALVMTIPLLRYLQLTTRKLWLNQSLIVAMILCALAAVGSQSRGALLGIAAMGTFLWLKSRNKIVTGLLGVLAVYLVINIMPDQWFERMNTIRNYEQDTSALMRINAWSMAFNLAKDRPFGAGFDSFRKYVFQLYAPNKDFVNDSHSIYFQMMGHHGFVGLGLFLLLGLMTWFTASWVIRNGKRSAEHRWAADLCAMVQVSLVGYATAGAFLGVAYFDLYYALITVVVLTKVVLVREKSAPKSTVAAATEARVAPPSGALTRRSG